MKKNFRNRLTLCVVAGVLSLSGGVMAYAATSTEAAAESTVMSPGAGGRGMGMKMDFSGLVSEGKISQDTADRITAYMEAQRAARGAERAEAGDMMPGERKALAAGEARERVDMFSEMVTAGIITQEEADILKEAAPVRGEGQEPGEFRGRGFHMFNTDTYVSSGIIDEATAASINNYMETKLEAMKSGIEKPEPLRDMELPEGGFNGERPEFNRPDVKNPITELVEAGLLTLEQADAILAAMPEPPAKPAFE